MPDFVQHNPLVSAFRTPQAYSTDFDVNYRAPDHVRVGEYRHGDGVSGWLTYDEGRTLWEMARGLRALELGRYEGRSTVSLAQSALFLVSVDTSSSQRAQWWLEKFVSDRKPETTHLLECDFAELPKRYPEPIFEFVFIDGDHTAAAVERDVATVLPLLTPGALLAFHDYLEAGHPDVQPTVDRLAIRHSWKRVRQVGRLAVFSS